MNDKIINFLNSLTNDEMNNLHFDLFIKNEWCGIKTEKNPIDAWLYQEIIYNKQPDVIIETGTFRGGSAIYFNNLLNFINKGKIITIDILERKKFKGTRITFIQGNSISDDIIKKVKNLISDIESVMVILDSDHSKEHVEKELELYSEFVTSGQYLVVEDTFLNSKIEKGPLKAINEFLKDNNNFFNDLTVDRFSFLSSNHQGYLLKK